MATELRLPSPAIFSPHMPSPRVQLPPIFPHPPASMTDTPATLPRRDCSQAYAMSSRYGSPYARPPSLSSSRLGPAVPADVPPTQSPARSLSSYSPSLVPSASSPRNFELPLDRKRTPRDASRTLASLRGEGLAGYVRTLPPLYTAGTRSPVVYLSSPAATESPSQRHNQVPYAPNHPQQRTDTRARRCQLYIRQQPRAARAGPDGKDRRTIDPPPILQLLIPDFDPDSPADMEDLKSAHWVVHCRLVSSSSPRQEMSLLSQTSDDGQSSVQRLLLGNYVSGPTFCDDDPDPDTAPEPLHSAPSSPSVRLMMARPPPSPPQRSLPAAFFIFADLSVRKAGEYRLEFKLMKMEPQLLFQGSTVPTLHSVTSDMFRVVNAKDFDQVQPSTKLVRGLLDRGAGFPLKLKKGPREGQSRRSRPGHEVGGDGDDDDDDDNDDDDNGDED